MVQAAGLASGETGDFWLVFKELAWSSGLRKLLWPLLEYEAPVRNVGSR